MKKGNSNIKPERIERLGNTVQVRWNITRNDRTDEDGNTIESWDYEYANCNSPEYNDIVEGVIRSVYTQDEVEAIFANYFEGKNEDEFEQFLKVRAKAKQIAEGSETVDDNYTPESFRFNAAKRLLQKVAEPVLQDEVNLTEQDIEDAKMLFEKWNGNSLNYEIDDKVVFNDELYKVIQAHTSQADWTPDTATSLFTKYRVSGTIEVWDQPESTNPYMKGEKVYYPTENDAVYESLIDDNVWSPADYPDGWEEQI